MQIKANFNYNTGFSLLELSIVIVLVGLIVTSILGAQSLVRQAKVRTVISDYNSYKIAADSFFLQYKALPGDFSKASGYSLGFDGNQDYRIFNENTESLYAWQHLGNAGMIPGEYSGDDAGGIDNVIGVNMPRMSIGDNVTAIFNPNIA